MGKQAISLDSSGGLLGWIISHAWKSVVLLWLVGLAGAGLAVVMPMMFGKATDLFAGNAPPQIKLVVYTISLGLLALSGQGIINYLKTIIGNNIKQRVGSDFSIATYKHLLRLSPDFFQRQEMEKINVRAMMDTQTVSNTYLEAIITMPLAVVTLFWFGYVMISTNVLLGLASLPLAGLSLFFLIFDRRMQRVNQQGMAAYDTVRSESSQLLQSVDEIRINNVFDYGTANLERAVNDRYNASKAMTQINAISAGMGPFLEAVQDGAIMLLGASLCLGIFMLPGQNKLTWGSVVMFLTLARMFRGPIQTIAGFLLQWRMAKESINRVQEYWHQPEVFVPNPSAPALPAGSPDVKFVAAAVRTHDGSSILADFSVSIESGNHVAFVGPSGCGKSTAMLLLTRQNNPAEGDVLLGGVSVQSLGIDGLAKQIGFVPQKPVIFNTSIRNNLLFSLRRDSEKMLKDEDGGIDISRWPDVASIKDIDTRLVSVVRMVGLEGDIMRKALAISLPVDAEKSLGSALLSVRSTFRAKLRDRMPDAIKLFNLVDYFPGSIGENIFGPGWVSGGLDSALCDQFLTNAAAPHVLEKIAISGIRLYQKDLNLAMRIAEKAPGLLKYLPSMAKNPDAPVIPPDLNTIPASERRIFINIFLDAAPDTWRMDSDFEALCTYAVDLRCKARESVSWKKTWDAIAADEWLPALSISDNLLGGRIDTRSLGSEENLQAVLADVLNENGLTEAVLILGMAFKVGEQGKFLSGGQRQKLAIARMLMKDPNLVLLDEATAALDELSQSRIKDLLKGPLKGKTILTITHRLNTIKDTDAIVVIDGGRVVQTGSYEDLVSRDGLFKSLVSHEHVPVQQPVAVTMPKPPMIADVGVVPVQGMLEKELARCELFSHMDSTQISFISRIARTIEVKRDEVLFRQGDEGDCLYLIIDGEIAFSSEDSASGKERRVTAYGAGRAFGELALFGNGKRTLSARAECDSRLAALYRDDLMGLIQEDPEVAVSLLRRLSIRIEELTNQYLNA